MRNGNISNNKKVNGYEIRENKIKKSQVSVMIIFFILCVLMIFEIVQLFNYTFGNVSKEDARLYNFISNTLLSNKIVDEEYKVNFAGLGDIYVSENILNGSKTSNGYDFITGTEEIQTKLKEFDVVIAPLSTPVAGASYGYTKSDVYNAPNEILDLMKKLNVSVVASASYHSLDKKEEGALSTIENIYNKNIQQVGLNSSESNSNPVIIEKNNIKLGILSYTRNSNIRMSKNEEYILDVLNEEDLNKDITYLKENNVDFIVAYLNVKNENPEIVNTLQKQGTEMLFNAGVNVVLGTGSKVIQEENEDLIKIDEKDFHVYCIYSLGDFIGDYETQKNKESLIANIEFVKKIIKDKKGNIIEQACDMVVKEPIKVNVEVSKNYYTTMSIVKSFSKN